MRAIYKLNFDCGRMGSIHGIFTAEITEMERLIESGQEVYFGEVLGKHSEISGPIEQSDITLVSREPEVVAEFERYEMATGHNPFDYIDELEAD